LESKETVGEALKILYLDVAHVLHPSESTYLLIHGKSPWSDGHNKYENVPVLARLLEPCPDVRIVLSDWTPVVHGLEEVKQSLGTLAERVLGTLYTDVTTKARRIVPLVSGGEREIGYSVDDFRRMSRAQAVSAHVAWFKPQSWLAVTSDYSDWTPEARERHVVLTDMLDALETRSAQDALSTALAANFDSKPRLPT
jgi:hypothetical protein